MKRKHLLEKQKKLAKERIERLFELAQEEFRNHPGRSDRYVDLARRIGMKFNVRIPPRLKRRFCKHCYKYLQQGVNCRVRMRKGIVVYHCLNCKKFMRFPTVREKKGAKKKRG